MVVSFSQLKNKKVYNIADGKNLGNVTDICFSFPEGKIEKIIVGTKKIFAASDGYEMNLCCVIKIGDDAIFVNFGANAEKIPEDE